MAAIKIPILDLQTPVVIVPHTPEAQRVVYDVWQNDRIIEGGYSHPSEQQAHQWATEMGYTVYAPAP